MKFFHLSDLHLGARLLNYSLRDDQVYILEQIVQSAAKEQPDAVLIAGDVFDKADPGPDAVSVFNDFITKLKAVLPDCAVMIISGNHDNGERINLYRDILKIADVYVAGRAPDPQTGPEKVMLHDENGPVAFYLLPFVRPGMVRGLAGEDEGPLSYEETVRRLIDCADPDPQIRNVLVSHQFFVPDGSAPKDVERMDSEVTRVGNLDAISAGILSPFDYTALGHLHKPGRAGQHAFYCGTPLAYSLSERGQQKSICVVELPAGEEPEIRKLPLTPLRTVRRAEGFLKDLTSGPVSEDYVEVILSDKKTADRNTVLSRLRQAFPNLLTYRFAGEDVSPALQAVTARRRELDPLQLCLDFLGSDADEEMEQILRDLIRELEAGISGPEN